MKQESRRRRDSVVFIFVLALFLCLTSICPAFADALWPAMIVTIRILAWVPILVGLLIEWLIVRRITGFDWWKSLKADLVMNLASSLLGLILLPLLGLVLIDSWFLEIGYNSSRSAYLGDQLGPPIWDIVYCFPFSVLAAFVNVGVEALVLSRVFTVPMTRKRFWMLYLANLASVLVASAFLVAQLLSASRVVSR